MRKEPNGWITIGDIEKSWTPPIYLPGCALIEVGLNLRHAGHEMPAAPLESLGALLVLAASPLAGWSLASLILAASYRERSVLGKFLWRFWVVLLSWTWVLVPLKYAFVYEYTVLY
jgi:hypothetical protein